MPETMGMLIIILTKNYAHRMEGRSLLLLELIATNYHYTVIFSFYMLSFVNLTRSFTKIEGLRYI